MLRLRWTALAALCMTTFVHAQDENASWTFDTYTPGVCSPNGGKHGGCPAGDLVRIHVVTIAHGLVRPWHITFLPGGADFLVTELPGELRIVRGGKLDPKPIPGWPADALRARSMNSVVLHPDFERNRLLYFSYVKQRDGGDTTIALARGRFDGKALERVEDVFVADAWGTGATAGRAEVGPDGMFYVTVGDRDAGNVTDDASYRMLAQDLGSHVGKVLRLRDDGTAPADNPFVGRADAQPEIYTYGHRNAQGLAWHPQTGELWATEVGPMGGDELNRLSAGQQLRLAARVARQDLHGQSGVRAVVVAARYGDARDVLGAGDQPLEPHDLHRRQVPPVARPLLHRRVERPAVAARRVQSAAAPAGAPGVAAHDARCACARRATGAGRLPLSRSRARPTVRARQREADTERIDPADRACEGLAHPMTRSTLVLLTLGALLAVNAHAQSSSPTDIPRLANGKPNLSGVWQAFTTANWNVLTHGASAGPPKYGALLATPPGYGIVDGDAIPYLPAAAEQQRRNYESRFEDDPEVKCYMPGVPRANYMPYPLQIFHSDAHLLVAYQFAGAARIVNLGAPQPSAIDSWMGISNARWDGDTLVVEVAGFNGLAWLDRAGNHASAALKVVERYTLAGADAIDYSATLEDPQTFSRPWTMRFRLLRNPDAKAHLMEFKCVPFTEELLYGDLYKQPRE